MRVACVSDQHGYLPEVEPCDLLLISGDICIDRDPPYEGVVFGRKSMVVDRCGSPAAIFAQSRWLSGPFAEWLDRTPAKRIVACWGNHDYIGQRRPDMVPKSLRWDILTDAGIEIDGFKIWGCPWQLWFHDWAFNAPHGAMGEVFMGERLAMVPDDTDIILCHGPPLGFGDQTVEGERTGSKALLDRINVVKPLLTVHGHIHCGRGEWKFPRGNAVDGTICNASVVNERYELVHKPFYFDLEKP
jgi:Icc-related predicted phosphoesterase